MKIYGIQWGMRLDGRKDAGRLEVLIVFEASKRQVNVLRQSDISKCTYVCTFASQRSFKEIQSLIVFYTNLRFYYYSTKKKTIILNKMCFALLKLGLGLIVFAFIQM